ncbi:hypothetical protein [uncultured Tenacibaculum sp.]|uniref:hypothetical protein n=1 Tax=uncultured Tenacibaculum sp. TaxID=174713 RepID=UPI0026123FE4|nr:hypothetical protein [uncultured Tenacibaculum sp.]
MNILKKHSVIALSYFLLITLLGVLLRCFSVIEIDFNYRHIVHAHSHIALLGWVYTAFMILIYKLYLKKANIERKYLRVFWSTQFTIIGMLVTFPFTGYALFSIVFSSLFIIASYFFGYLVFKYTPKELKKTNSYKCIQLALWYMIISSIGPWALGAIMNTLGESSSWYRNAIYFYLHFQYNGWFILGLVGLLLRVFELKGLYIPRKVFKPFFLLFNIGIIVTFLISILWMKLGYVINVIAGIGGLFQIIAFTILLKEIHKQKEQLLNAFSNVLVLVFKTVVILFVIKLAMQIIGMIPYLAQVVSSYIDFVIGYIHWIFLGIVSLSLLGFLELYKYLQLTKRMVVMYLLVFLITEVLIFYKGIVVWRNLNLSYYFNHYLLFASMLFLVLITYLFVKQLRS